MKIGKKIETLVSSKQRIKWVLLDLLHTILTVYFHLIIRTMAL